MSWSSLSFLLFFLFYVQLAASVKHDNVTDLAALMSFRSLVDDPMGSLATWTQNTPFCGWAGVSCAPRHGRVVALQLSGFSLGGSLSPDLGNLSFLTNLDLVNNSFHGPIPGSLGRLRRLASLNLSINRLSSSIPSSLFNMSSLTHLNLQTNNLSGPLPASNESYILPKAYFISLEANQLSGPIPLVLARCHNLRVLSLSTNRFTGTIPSDLFTSFPLLSMLSLSTNLLSGTIPASVGNLTRLTQLDLSANHLLGEVPSELGHLVNIAKLNLGNNSLSGPIPASLSNASMLKMLDLDVNELSGAVPVDLGKNLPSLMIIHLGWNRLSGRLVDFIPSFSNCRMQKMALLHNEFEGVIPDAVGNLSSTLYWLNLGGNYLTGEIPASLSNLSSLLMLDLDSNRLSGSIPPEIAKIKGLQALYLGNNSLSGTVPQEIGQLRNLVQLNIEGNVISGALPESVGNLTNLQKLWSGGNNISSIPGSIWRLNQLVLMNISKNSLEGLIPTDVGQLTVVNSLDLSANKLSGSIPETIGQFQMVGYLNFSGNSFTGLIPQSIGKLVNINQLDLSWNNLSGPIPDSLVKPRYLVGLNLSHNNLEGRIPSGGVFSNITSQSLIGNAGLCGAPTLGFPPCFIPMPESHHRHRAHLLQIVIPIITFALLLYFSCALVYRRRNMHPAPTTGAQDLKEYEIISYHELLRGTNNFSESNLLGTGSFGAVYRARRNDGSLVAVKVFNLEREGSSKSFDSECHVLAQARHRNLVKIITSCSNLDFKALVLEFVPNGSLERWLHNDPSLTFAQRISIVLDVAHALDYLHHHHHQVILHCDVKPSNVLLDEEMNARLGDFGIAKLLAADTKSLASASTAGTIGYIAPEFASTGSVSRRAYVYSFGILLLETFTGKKPTDSAFDGKSNLREWTANAYPTRLWEVLDGNLSGDHELNERMGTAPAGDGSVWHQCVVSLFKLALQCSRDEPKERISMKHVVHRLQKIKLQYLGSPSN